MSIVSGLVQPADPKPPAISLARYLLCIAPDSAEWSWQSGDAMDQSPGHWFALRKASHTTYMLAGESGRFSLTPPEGIDPATLPVVDESGPSPTGLRDFLDTLAQTIADAEPGSADRIKAIARAARNGDSLGILRSELNAIVAGFAMHPPNVPDVAFASELEVQTRQRFINLEIPGTLASAIYLLTRIARLAAPANMIHQAFGLGGSLDIFDGPQVFLRDVLAKIFKIEGGETKIAEAAAALQDDAESFADLAENAPDFGQFYGGIFESLPLAYAAQQGFEYLANAGAGKPGNYKMLANVCEERVAPAFATMEIDFRNSMDWRAIAAHRAAIAAARQSGGDSAAEQLADQYTHLSLLYPPFTRDFLLEKTDTLPLKAEVKQLPAESR